MDIIYQIIELSATFIEGLIVLFVTTEMLKKKFSKKKHILFLIFSAVIYTAIITLLNHWHIFSFLTIIIGIAYLFAAVTFLCSDSPIYRITAVMLSLFFINATDYIIAYGFIMIIGKSIDLSDGMHLILKQGMSRTIYLGFLKTLQIIIFLSCKKFYQRFRQLKKQSVRFLFIIAVISYVMMSVLTQLIITYSRLTMQFAVIFSVLFITLSMITTLFALYSDAKFQDEKRDKQVFALSNEMMEKNFNEIRDSQNIIRRQVHDFKNHLRAIRGMVPAGSPAQAYIDNLLEESYISAQYCRSGNNIIDSIINCKLSQAEKCEIKFTYSIVLTAPLNISPVDICAILANQLDNAIEACVKTDDKKKRFVKGEIWQKESFVFFKVTNSCSNNPFDKNHELPSTKKSTHALHGYGIKNINDTVAKYNGTLKNEYTDGVFFSVAMISIPTDTE